MSSNVQFSIIFLKYCLHHFNDVHYVTASQDGVYTKQFSLLFSTLNLCCQWIICVRAHKLFFSLSSSSFFLLHPYLFIIFIFISGLRKFSINGLFSMCAIYIIFSPVPNECLYRIVCVCKCMFVCVCVSKWMSLLCIREAYIIWLKIYGGKKTTI